MATEPWCHAASPWESICIRMSNHDGRHRDDQSRSWEQHADSVPLLARERIRFVALDAVMLAARSIGWLMATEPQDVLDEFNFGDGVVNAGDDDARRMAEEIAHLRDVLVFADGCVLANNMRCCDYDFVLADLYAEDCRWAQDVLRRAGCHERGKFVSDSGGG